MPKPYDKPPLSLQDQLSHLQKRGLKINHPKAALTTLSNISYYRLSAYWYPYREHKPSGETLNNFIADTSFEAIIDHYEFDRKLRLLVLDAVERIEVSLRTRVTYHLAHQYGAFGHTIAANFHPKFQHQKWLEELEKKEALRSQEEFIRHFKNIYQGFPTLPIWMATEIISLGLLSKLIKGLKPNDRRVIASIYGLHHKTLADWLHVLTYVRNICAHHARLWNRQLAIRPTLQGLGASWLPPEVPRNDKLFIVVLIIKQLLQVNGSGRDWQQDFEKLMSTVNSSFHQHMGFPQNWQAHKLWANHFN